MLGVSAETLDSLRARIATIEKRPALTDHPAPQAMDSRLVFALPGQLQEIFAAARRDAGATLGFALGMARGLLTPRRPALLIVQMKNESADMGVPYGAGLKSFGIDPDCVVLVRAETITEFLWAIEEAIGCEAVAAVIADLGRPHRELDFTASRRLSLRVATGGSTVFLLRYGGEREATAAHLRWGIIPAGSTETPFDPRAPGEPGWHLDLERGHLGQRKAPISLMLDWTENGFALVDPYRRSAAHPAGAPVSGVVPATMGYRLSEAS